MLWLSKQAGPAGEVLRRSHRELSAHHPRPRPSHRHRDWRDARRQDHRAESLDAGQPRRIPLDDRAGHSDHALWADGGRLLQDPEYPRRRKRGLHQHGHGRRLSRRGSARGDVRHRAHLRPGCGCHRHRSSGGAPAQLHSAGGFSLRYGARHAAVRQRQLRAGARQGVAAGRLRELCVEEQADTPRQRLKQAPWHRTVVLRRSLRRRALEVDRARRPGLGRWSLGERRGPGLSDRQGVGDHWLAAARAGARDDVRPARIRRARNPVRGHRDRALRHQGHALRFRLLREPLTGCRRHRDLQERAEGRREGQAAGGAHAGGGAGGHRLRERQGLGEGIA